MLARLRHPEDRTRLLITGAVALVSLVYLAPLYFVLVFATHPVEATYDFPPPVGFGTALAENYARIHSSFEPYRPILNSLLVAIPKTAGLVLVSALAGYGFARYRRVQGHRPLLMVAFATMFFPPSLGLIPFFIEMRWFGWLDTFWPLIVPAMASSLGVVWMYTYIQASVPDELYEAAEIDGAGGLRTFRIVVLPIIRPGLAALGVWVFITTWNDFKLPLIVLSSAERLTVPLALMSLNSLYVADTPAVMLGIAISLVPVFAVFFLLSKQFIAGLTSGAVKS